MIICSVTITCGVGSERHNHDTQYRSTMEHVISGPEDVIELMPYIPYNVQINGIMHPYIDQYNQRRDERYADALARYQAGELNHKPSPSSYTHMDYDYASTHATSKHRHQTTGRVEADPIYKSVIIGLGDKHDRQLIDRDQAIAVFEALPTAIQDAFPYFRVLGCTLHLDEEGFFHCHVDYFVAAPKVAWKSDLPVYRGQDRALQMMGYLPEQSIVNASEKQPLYFNAMRNKLYNIMQYAMDKQGIRLQYGISRDKYPYKDPSKNMRLEVWQDAQDRFIALQNYRNQIVEVLSSPDMQVQDLKSAAAIIHSIRKIVEGKTDLAPITLMHGYRVTGELLNRYISATTRILNDMRMHIQAQETHLQDLKQSICVLEDQRDQLRREIADLQSIRRDIQTPAAISEPSALQSMEGQRNQPIRSKKKQNSMEEWMELIRQVRANQESPASHCPSKSHSKNRE